MLSSCGKTCRRDDDFEVVVVNILIGGYVVQLPGYLLTGYVQVPEYFLTGYVQVPDGDNVRQRLSLSRFGGCNTLLNW